MNLFRKWLLQRANWLRRLINLWPPLLGAGIKVTEMRSDYKYARVELALNVFNQNFVGTQYGGSLFSMTDTMYMLMLLHLLGPEYYVWDYQAEIRFVTVGKSRVSAEFMLKDEDIEAIRRATVSGEKHLAEFDVEIRDIANKLVARVKRVIYIKKKPHYHG